MNKLTLLTLLIFTSKYSFGGEWIFDPKSGCRLWNPNPEPNESIIYKGGCVDRKANGTGTEKWFVNGKLYSTYVGKYKNGKHHGKGKLTWTDGAVYTGDIKEGLFHGKGTFIWNGSKYYGDWKDDKKHGTGKYTFEDGSIWEGEWVNGQKQEKLTNERIVSSEKTNNDAAIIGATVAAAVVVGGLAWLFGGDDDSSSSYSSSSVNVKKKAYVCKVWCRTSGGFGERKYGGSHTVYAFPGSEYEQMTPICESTFAPHWYNQDYSCELRN